jgi:saccharopine dehydrogenase-like NADP-dependent oxidoreductase
MVQAASNCDAGTLLAMTREVSVHKVVILGGGKIGRMIAKFLTGAGHYEVTVADNDTESLSRLSEQSPVDVERVDASDIDQLRKVCTGKDGIISALSFRFNPTVAQVALETGSHYFDLTEDVETTRKVRELADSARAGQVFAPQCGLAPGFVSIAARHLTRSLDKLDTVFMRVGALPQFPSNALKYNLTWSTDGLINEYCNPCEAIVAGKRADVLPLEGLELFSLDGVRYEAFNTSGGLGSLCDTLDGQVRELNYKTIRYQGHRQLMAFLVNELRFSEHRDQFKEILERAVPVTFQDVVVVFCTVNGWRQGQYVQVTDARKIYHQEIMGENWSAIQITTGAGICAVVDMVFEDDVEVEGFLRQEQIDLNRFLENRFGQYYQTTVASRFALGSGGD